MKRFYFVLLLMVSFAFSNEGMWLPQQISALNLKSEGFEISADEIYHPENPSISNAIVWLGNCSASFVSPRGLVLTNHHCAYFGLQKASAQDRKNFIETGYIAQDIENELPLPGQKAYVLQKIEDVTRDIEKAARYGQDLKSREDMRKHRIREIVENEENGREDIYCKVAKMFEGRQYLKYTYKVYLDVRAVFAPPASIGKYGGDIDNWMWPRHTGDFTILRVYQAPDGRGSDYHEENIPLKTENYLKISKRDLNNEDVAFIMGFPGSTKRYLTSHDVSWYLDYKYKPQILRYQDLSDRMEEFSVNDPDAEIKLASMHASLENTMKKYRGIVEGMNKISFLSMKKQQEAEFSDFIDNKYKTRRRYGHILEKINGLYREREEFNRIDKALDGFGYLSGVLYYLADYAYYVACERDKPESDRDPDFSEKRVDEFVKRIKYRYLGYYPEYDQLALVKSIERAKRLPQQLQFMDFPENTEKWVKNMYAETQMSDLEFVERLFSMNKTQIDDLDDSIIQLARQLYAPKQMKKERMKFWQARMNDLRKSYLEAYRIWKNNKEIYPDANSTLRFTSGHVRGYTPKDAVFYKPFTTMHGIQEKNTGKAPFNAPEKLISLISNYESEKWADKDLNDVPVCFLMTGDITGGNSGSAVMNGRGELIGLAFDGNYEAMTSDWMYQDEIQRVIVVDIRYILFLTENYANADWLLEEMRVK